MLDRVRLTIGVTRVGHFGQSIAIVPEQIIYDLQTKAGSRSRLHPFHPVAMPEHGAAVETADDPFEGLEGVYERKRGNDRVLILLSLLGRLTHVQISTDSISLLFSAWE